jgi:hypothetical protein
MRKDIPHAERTYLAVPYAERHEAKALGARWDAAKKAWYVGPEADREKIAKWEPKHQPVPALDPRAEFAAVLREIGAIVEGEHPIMNGDAQRIPATNDKRGELTIFYIAHEDGVPNGYAENNRTKQVIRWKAMGKHLSPEAMADLAALAEQKRYARKHAERELYETTAQRLVEELRINNSGVSQTAYHKAKQIEATPGGFWCKFQKRSARGPGRPRRKGVTRLPKSGLNLNFAPDPPGLLLDAKFLGLCRPSRDVALRGNKKTLLFDAKGGSFTPTSIDNGGLHLSGSGEGEYTGTSCLGPAVVASANSDGAGADDGPVAWAIGGGNSFRTCCRTCDSVDCPSGKHVPGSHQDGRDTPSVQFHCFGPRVLTGPGVFAKSGSADFPLFRGDDRDCNRHRHQLGTTCQARPIHRFGNGLSPHARDAACQGSCRVEPIAHRRSDRGVDSVELCESSFGTGHACNRRSGDRHRVDSHRGEG